MFYREAKISSNNDPVTDIDFTKGKRKYKQIQPHGLVPLLGTRKKTIFPHLVRRKFLQLNCLLKVIHSLLVKRNSILINNYEIHWNESSEVIFKSIPLSSSINKVIKLK